jgi:hypothetical protein
MCGNIIICCEGVDSGEAIAQGALDFPIISTDKSGMEYIVFRQYCSYATDTAIMPSEPCPKCFLP